MVSKFYSWPSIIHTDWTWYWKITSLFDMQCSNTSGLSHTKQVSCTIYHRFFVPLTKVTYFHGAHAHNIVYSFQYDFLTSSGCWTGSLSVTMSSGWRGWSWAGERESCLKLDTTGKISWLERGILLPVPKPLYWETALASASANIYTKQRRLS